MPSLLLTSVLTTCTFVLFLGATHTENKQRNLPLPSPQRLSVSGIVFFNQKKWTFWLNGVLIDSSGGGQDMLRLQGLKVLTVSKNRVFLGKDTRVIALKPCQHHCAAPKLISEQKPRLPRVARTSNSKNTSLGFAR